MLPPDESGRGSPVHLASPLSIRTNVFSLSLPDNGARTLVVPTGQKLVIMKYFSNKSLMCPMLRPPVSVVPLEDDRQAMLSSSSKDMRSRPIGLVKKKQLLSESRFTSTMDDPPDVPLYVAPTTADSDSDDGSRPTTMDLSAVQRVRKSQRERELMVLNEGGSVRRLDRPACRCLLVATPRPDPNPPPPLLPPQVSFVGTSLGTVHKVLNPRADKASIKEVNFRPPAHKPTVRPFTPAAPLGGGGV